MAGERYVLLGLAQPRTPWFREVGQWAASSAIAAEFVKCLSPEEVRARLASGRPHSALLMDASHPSFDRDTAAVAARSDTIVIAVTDGRGPTWLAADLGVAAVLPAGFGPDELTEVLVAHARLIGRGDGLPPLLSEPVAAPWRGQLLAVCGPGGTGTSTVAIALAQALAADPRYGRRVLLADLALRADQAMLHDAREVGPGIQELVDAHRLSRPSPDDIRAATFDAPTRGYRLLLGLRRPAAWSALRPRAFDAALEGLRRSFQAVVADVNSDVEGEAEGGSIDVEERNHPARSALGTADAVLVVGAPGIKGIHTLGGQVRSLLDFGVAPGRLLPVVNRGPRSPRARSELTAALASQLAGSPVPSPLYVPERKVEDALRDGSVLPTAFVTPIAGAVRVVLARQSDTGPPVQEPTRIEPGSLGSWADEEAGGW